jgi:hypothetical protein
MPRRDEAPTKAFDWGGILSALIGVIRVLLLFGWVARRTVPE